MVEEYVNYLRGLNNSLIRQGINLPIQLNADGEGIERDINILEQYLYFNDVLKECDSAYVVKPLPFQSLGSYKDILKEELMPEIVAQVEKENERVEVTPPDPFKSATPLMNVKDVVTFGAELNISDKLGAVINPDMKATDAFNLILNLHENAEKDSEDMSEDDEDDWGVDDSAEDYAQDSSKFFEGSTTDIQDESILNDSSEEGGFYDDSEGDDDFGEFEDDTEGDDFDADADEFGEDTENEINIDSSQSEEYINNSEDEEDAFGEPDEYSEESEFDVDEDDFGIDDEEQESSSIGVSETATPSFDAFSTDGIVSFSKESSDEDDDFGEPDEGDYNADDDDFGEPDDDDYSADDADFGEPDSEEYIDDGDDDFGEPGEDNYSADDDDFGEPDEDDDADFGEPDEDDDADFGEPDEDDDGSEDNMQQGYTQEQSSTSYYDDSEEDYDMDFSDPYDTSSIPKGLQGYDPDEEDDYDIGNAFDEFDKQHKGVSSTPNLVPQATATGNSNTNTKNTNQMAGEDRLVESLVSISDKVSKGAGKLFNSLKKSIKSSLDNDNADN